MGSFQFFVVIMTFYSYSVEAAKISCDVEALEWNEKLLAGFDRSIFWTTVYRHGYSIGGPFTRLDGFERGFKLVRTLFKLNDKYPVSYGLSMNAGMSENVDQNDIYLQFNEYVKDDERAIFQYKPERMATIITWDNEKENYGNLSDFKSEEREENAFALVYEEDGEFRIFRTCDGKAAWVQIADRVLKHYWKEEYGNKFQSFCDIEDTTLPPTLHELNQITIDKLDGLEVPGKEFKILDRFLSTYVSEFSRQFNLVDLAAMYMEDYFGI